MKTPPREYVETQIAKCRAAIAYAAPGADMSYARALLAAAETKLANMNAAN
jgi:hypothetical protein